MYDFYRLVGDVGGVVVGGIGILLSTSCVSLYNFAGEFLRSKFRALSNPTDSDGQQQEKSIGDYTKSD